MLDVEIINSPEQFYALRSEWNSILDQKDSNNPFLRHEWLSSWWKGYGSDKELFVVGFKKGNEYIGFAPLMKYKTKLVGIPVKAIGFITNHWVGLDFIVQDEQSHEDIIAELLSCLLKQREVVILSYFNQGSANCSVLEDELKKQGLHFSLNNKQALYFDIEGTWPEYLKQRAASFRDENRKKRKRLEKLGVLEFTRFSGSFDTDKVLSDIKAVSEQSWQNKKGVAILSEKKGLDFYRALIEQWRGNSFIDISLLRLDQKPIAYQIGVNFNGIFYAFETAYDEAYRDFSPGLVVMNMLLEQMFAEQKPKRFDFGLSVEYKQRWTESSNAVIAVTIFPRGYLGKALFSLTRLKERIKRNEKLLK